MSVYRFHDKIAHRRYETGCRVLGFCEVIQIVRYLAPGGLTAAEIMALPWGEQMVLQIDARKPGYEAKSGPSPDELAAIHVEKIETERREMAEREKRDAELYRRHLDDTNRKNNLRIMEQIREGFRRRER